MARKAAEAAAAGASPTASEGMRKRAKMDAEGQAQEQTQGGATMGKKDD